METESVTAALFNDIILDNIFGLVDIGTLKSCRLVCSKWQSATEKLFKRRAAVVLLPPTYSPMYRNRGTELNSACSSDSVRDDPLAEELSKLRDIIAQSSSTVPFNALKIKQENAFDNAAIIDFLQNHGSELREISVIIKCEENFNLSMKKIVNFRNLLLNYTPHIERIKLNIDFHSNLMFQTSDNENKAEDVGGNLFYVKELELVTWAPFLEHEAVDRVCKLLSGLLETTKMFNKLDIGNPISLEIARNLTDSAISTMKILKVTLFIDRFEESIIENSVAFEIFQDLSSQGLRLESFGVNYQYDCPIDFIPLMTFLKTQAKNLKRLQLKICFHDSGFDATENWSFDANAVFTSDEDEDETDSDSEWDFGFSFFQKMEIQRERIEFGEPQIPMPKIQVPQFPEMEKLEHLEIMYLSEDCLLPRFTFESWIDRFPSLKKLMLCLDTNHTFWRATQTEVFLDFLNMFSGQGKNLSEIHIKLHYCSRSLNDKHRILNLDFCIKYFDAAKEYFPHLISIKITHADDRKMVFYNGNIEDAVQTFNEEESEDSF